MQKRNILLWLYSFSIICNTLVSMSMDIAIVSMVNKSGVLNADETDDAVCQNTTFRWGENANKKNNKNQKMKTETYNWSNANQNTILSAFYWLNWLAILPGGLLSQKFGSKNVNGCAQGISSLMSALIPIFAASGPQPVEYIRAIQGFFSMVAIPGSSFTIIGNWIPPDERGKLMLIHTITAVATTAFGSIAFGSIAEYTNWKYIFYLTSVCGLIWVLLWSWLIHDTPEEHPDISAQEKDYIVKSLQSSSHRENVPIPWNDIFTSLPFYACALSAGATTWHSTMLTTYTPTYLKSMYGLNTNQIGFINSLPQFASGGSLFVAAFGLDIIVKKKLLSITNSRKFFAFFGGIISAIPLIIIAYTGCDIMLVIACLVISTVARNVTVLGAIVATIDMSPKFCGTLEGIAGTFSAIQTLVLTTFKNSLSYNTPTREMWKIVFVTTGAISIVCSFLFAVFGTAEIQTWNFGPTKRTQGQEETYFAKSKENHYGT